MRGLSDFDFVQLAEDIGEAAKLAFHNFQAVDEFRIGDRGIVEQQLYVAERGRQGIVGVVTDAPHELHEFIESFFRHDAR